MEFTELKDFIDSLWLMVAVAFVFLMLVGFLARESGLTRSKNSANVAAKILGSLSVSILLFWLVGFGLMFGIPGRGLGVYGVSAFGLDFMIDPAGNASDTDVAGMASFFLFQALLCATALTIMIGAAAERIRFESALLVAILFTGLVYPIAGHWSWAGLTEGTRWGWLGMRGFVDFGGATVIHSVAGWAALAMLFLVKPRLGRFTSLGEVKLLPKSSPTLAAIGTLLIWVGWFGIVGGRMHWTDNATDAIFANLLIAGAVGVVAVIPVSILFRAGRVEFDLLLNGALAGLVAISGGVHAFSPRQVVIIAMIGAWLMLALWGLLLRSRIDDATGVIPVHLAAGIWGTVAVALFGNPQLLNTDLSTSNQLIIQLGGALAIGFWSFIVMLICLNVLNLIFSLRISEDEEIIGLNMAEQGEMPDYSDYPGLGELLG